MEQQQVTPDQAIAIAIQHHQAGRLPDAEAIYRKVLGIDPDRFDALHLLGVLAYQVGRTDAAIELIRRALTFKPDFAEAHYNLGNALLADHKSQQARVAYARAIELKPNYAEAHNNLGNALHDQGKMEEAIASYDRALEISPRFVDAHFNRANVKKGQGKIEEAISGYLTAIHLKDDYAEAYSSLGDALRLSGKLPDALAACNKAIELRPDLAAAYNNLGNVLRDQGKFPEAFAAWSKAIELKGDFAAAHYNIGNALRDSGKPEEAIASYRHAIQLKPDFADAHYNLGNCLTAQGKFEEAAAEYSTAASLAPANAEALNNLGVIQKEQGLIEQAMASFDRAFALRPDNPGIGSNRLYAMHFLPGHDTAKLREVHQQWNDLHALPLKKSIVPHTPPSYAGDADRRLRIGYVSANFQMHSVGRFFLPILSRHDKAHFDVFCYSDVRAPDAMTEAFQKTATQWREIVGQTDEQVAQQIRQDGIDILIDLSKHTGNNRLLAFARKPAPIQVTYLPYCSTSGLEAMDYRLTDAVLDPPAQGDKSYIEKTIRLPDGYFCYDPITSLEISPPPALKAGRLTFGCLNSFAKISTTVLSLWARILRESPNTRLLLHVLEGSPRQHVIDTFQKEGVDPQRVTFVSRVSGQDYFELYQTIDIALDPFPCPGAITTCDALWMGVPVVSLSGSTAVGRTGASILTTVTLAGLVARSEEHYVRKAVELAKDATRLGALRSGLRKRMQKSPLIDVPRFTQNLETAYRQMWHHWCGKL